MGGGVTVHVEVGGGVAAHRDGREVSDCLRFFFFAAEHSFENCRYILDHLHHHPPHLLAYLWEVETPSSIRSVGAS